MILNQNNSAVLIIDVQEKLINAVFNKDTVIKKANVITKAASILNIPIFVTEQYPQGLGETIGDLKQNAKVYTKTTFNALFDENLLNDLKTSGKKPKWNKLRLSTQLLLLEVSWREIRAELKKHMRK